MLNLDDISAQHHTLSIRLAPDGFSFFVLNVKEHKVIAFKHSHIELHQDAVVVALNALRSEEVFSYPFERVQVLIDFPAVTTVPSSLYSEDKIEELFGLNIDAGLNEYVLSNHSSAYDLEVLFSIPKELYTFFNKNFPKINFIHKLSTVLNDANAYENKAQEQLFISYTEHHFTAVALRNNSLIYHNCFNLNSPEDLVYYFLLVYQELGFDQYQANVLIDGIIEEGSKELDIVREYIKHISFAKLHQDYIYPETVKAEPEHYYSNLFTLPYCAS